LLGATATSRDEAPAPGHCGEFVQQAVLAASDPALDGEESALTSLELFEFVFELFENVGAAIHQLKFLVGSGSFGVG